MYKILYNIYFYKFMKENNKSEKEINWNRWTFLDKQCSKYYNLMEKER